MIPVLETERLVLREGRDGDFDALVAFYADVEASKPVGGPLSRAEAWGRVAFNRGHWALRGYGNWAIEEKATGDYVGWSGLWFPEGFPEREVGWGLMRSKRGRGYATEAALRARMYAYESLGWETAISLIAADMSRPPASPNGSARPSSASCNTTGWSSASTAIPPRKALPLHPMQFTERKT